MAVPAWWSEEFAIRQRRLRALLVRYLQAEGRLCTQHLRMHTHSYSKNEFHHCLKAMVADKAIMATDEMVPTLYGARQAVLTTYYDLAHRAPSTKKS